MPLSTTNHANNRKTLPLFLTDYAARKCLIQQLITELGVSYINKASDALIDVGTAKIRHAVLGDDKVNIVAGEADGSTALELADDLGDLVALTGGLVLDHGSGVQSDDGASAIAKAVNPISIKSETCECLKSCILIRLTPACFAPLSIS